MTHTWHTCFHTFWSDNLTNYWGIYSSGTFQRSLTIFLNDWQYTQDNLKPITNWQIYLQQGELTFRKLYYISCEDSTKQIIGASVLLIFEEICWKNLLYQIPHQTLRRRLPLLVIGERSSSESPHRTLQTLEKTSSPAYHRGTLNRSVLTLPQRSTQLRRHERPISNDQHKVAVGSTKGARFIQLQWGKRNSAFCVVDDGKVAYEDIARTSSEFRALR